MSAESPLGGRSVAVTGAAGFIGSRVVEKLARDHGAKVTAIGRRRTRTAQLAGLDLRIAHADLGNRADIERAVAENEIVVNCAYDFRAPGNDNVAGFRNLLEACAAVGVKRLVQVSSIVVYDDWPDGALTEDSPAERPGTDYKNAKMAMEAALSGAALSSAIVQPTIVYGPGSWMWTDRIVEQLALGTVILPDRADGNCPAVYVDDVADAILLAAARQGGTAEKFIVSGPDAVTWSAFFEGYAGILGADSIRYVPVAELTREKDAPPKGLRDLIANPLQIASWGPARRLHNALRRAVGDRPIEALRAFLMKLRSRRGPIVVYPGEYEMTLYLGRGSCDIGKARRELGYTPAFDFAAGLERTADYIRRTYPDFVKGGDDAPTG